MEKTRRYEIEGLVIDIPIREDETTGRTFEIYPDFIETPIWTPKGNRVLFSGTDACPLAEEASESGCPDCASCRHFKWAGEHTWFGICTNEIKRKNTNIQGETL